MKIKTKLIVSSIALAVTPLLLASIVISYYVSGESEAALRQEKINSLVSLREARKEAILSYFGTVRKQVQTLASAEGVVYAMKTMPNEIELASYALDSEEVSVMRVELLDYYQKSFNDTFMQRNTGGSADVAAIINGLDDTGIVLQHRYIKSNPNKPGEKSLLNDSEDGSRYSELHKRLHPGIREYLQAFEYYDIYLIDSSTSQVVYSVNKKLDYAVSLETGIFSESGLGRVFKAANAQTVKGATAITDFSVYLPSYNDMAAFIATPIFFEGEKLGVLAFQLPMDVINDVMTEHGSWDKSGLGDSGQIYLVGEDMRMRSAHRQQIADSNSFIDSIAESGIPSEIVDRIRVTNSTVGLFPVNFDHVMQAVNGSDGVITYEDLLGNRVMSAYTPLSLQGLNWALFADISEDESLAQVEDAVSSINSVLYSISGVLLLIAGIVGVLLANDLVKPVLRLRMQMRSVEENADLSVRLPTARCNEISDANHAINQMLVKLDTAMQNIAHASNELARESDRMAIVSNETRDGVLRQKNETDQLATAITEMAASIQEVATNAALAAESAIQADSKASEGMNVVKQAISSINGLSGEVNKAADVIEKLENESVNIGSVLDVIKSIAEQTNLLALNAAIEAARAGEQGRGFAVVADEVRSLASRTQQSTEEIQSMIESIQNEAGNAVSVMKESRNKADDSVEKAAQVSENLTEIVKAVTMINDMNAQIAIAAEEQSAVSDEISRSISNISKIADTTASGAEGTSSSSEKVAQHAVVLNNQVSRFKLSR